MRRRRLIPAAAFVLPLVAVALTSELHAQSAAELLARGIRATHDLEFDSAASWLRRSLAPTTRGPLTLDADRSRALMYLGATEFFRDHRDSAVAAFRRLIVADPKFRPDLLVFPPEVTTLFNEVRQGTRAVAMDVATRTDLNGPGDRLVARLYASSIHDVIVAVTWDGSDGQTVRSLYSGAIGDSLQILWDGRDANGLPVDSGSYVLRVASRGPDSRIVRSVEVPLEVRQERQDTLPEPPPLDPRLQRVERTDGHGGARALTVGLLTAAAAVALPAMVAPHSSASPARFAVASTAGLAGIFGLVYARTPRPIPENIAWNQRQQLAWQHQMDQVHAENDRRLRQAHLVVFAGPAVTVEGSR